MNTGLSMQAYEKYVKLPLANVVKPSAIYDRAYVVFTGLSIISPHPHRHFTYDEFLKKYEADQTFREFIERESLN